MPVSRYGARLGAAAFALGLSLAGPQAAGLAAADDSGPQTPSVSEADAPGGKSAQPGRTRGGRPATSDLRQARWAAAAPDNVTTSSRSARSESGSPWRPAAQVRPSSAGSSVPAAVVRPSAEVPSVAAGPEPELALPAAAVAASDPPRRRAAVPTALPVGPIAAAPLVSAVPAAVSATAAKAAPADPIQAINTVVAGLFDSAQNLLSALPGGPLSDFVSGALLLVRRTLVPGSIVAPQTSAVAAANGWAGATPSGATLAMTNWFGDSWQWLRSIDSPLAAAVRNALIGVQNALFSPVAAVKPEQLTAWTPGEPILGKLRSVQPGGAGVSFQLTQAPTAGTVQLLYDGSYTYVPGADFTGTDSFTAQVTSAGFNILDPFTPRTASVVVAINPFPAVSVSKGWTIENRSADILRLKDWWFEPGHDGADGPEFGSLLLPGESHRFEIYSPAIFSQNYDTRAEYVDGYNPAGPALFRGVMRSYGDYGFCEVGSCAYGKWGPYAPGHTGGDPILFMFPGAPSSVTDIYPNSPNAETVVKGLLSHSWENEPYDGRANLDTTNIRLVDIAPDDFTNAKVLLNSSNNNARPYTYSESRANSFSTTTGYNWKVSINFEWSVLEKTFTKKLGAEYGRSESETNTSTTTDTVTLTFPPYSRYVVLLGNPVKRAIADATLTWSNGSKTVLRDVDFIYPDPTTTSPGLIISSFFGPISAGFSVRDKNPPQRPENPGGVADPTYPVGHVGQLYVQGYNGDTVNGAAPDFTNPTTGRTTYSSSNTSVATVDAKGRVTAVGVGDAVISVNYTYTLPREGGKTVEGSAQTSLTVHVV